MLGKLMEYCLGCLMSQHPLSFVYTDKGSIQVFILGVDANQKWTLTLSVLGGRDLQCPVEEKRTVFGETLGSG